MSMETVNFEHLNLKPGDRVLDLGCGEGRHTITAYLMGNVDSVGVDLSLKDLNTTRQRFSEFEDENNHQKSLNISVANGESLPFGDNTFDKIICSEVLEHIPNYRAVLKEITRVLKTGGVFVASVPRFFPEWVCWQFSDAYHEVEGGHVRIFNATHLREDIETNGFIFFKRHWAHSLHVPYWWLKCIFWREADEPQAAIVEWYHKFLVWDLMKKPWITQVLDKLFNPLLGKSVVMYFVKTLVPQHQLDATAINTESNDNLSNESATNSTSEVSSS